jgi:hypothetical protein
LLVAGRRLLLQVDVPVGSVFAFVDPVAEASIFGAYLRAVLNNVS